MYEDGTNIYQGTGAIKVNIPHGITAIIKVTKSAGSWNLSTYKYLKVYLLSYATVTYNTLYFGEAAYNEQSHAVGITGPHYWYQAIWNISGIGSGDRDAATMFAISLTASGATSAMVWIDYLFADPGASQIKAFDGDRVILLYPKVYTGSYVGNGGAQTIDIPRKGTPTAIRIIRLGSYGCSWITGMTAGHSNKEDGTNLTTGITAVADCSFSVGNAVCVNEAQETYYFIAWWDD
jgi:hypothetical protein